MSDNLIDLRSQMAQEADDADPDHPHCARCGGNSPVATLMVAPLAVPVGEEGYAATICDPCVNRILDLLVNPHLLVTARTTDTITMAAEVQVDGASVSREDAVEILRHAANMLEAGIEPEIITMYDNPSLNEDT